VPDQTELARAQLIEFDLGDVKQERDPQPLPGGRTVTVQFNPESLKLTSANTVAKTDTAGSAAMQFVASSSTKLDLELWFDATVDPGQTDLSKLTEGVYYFITPQKQPTFKVPGVRFQWGSFTFDGVVTSLNETLEMFSHDGRPLRSRISLSFASQEIRFRVEGMEEGTSGGPGQTPQTPVKQGDSVQQLASRAGASSSDWRAIAAANGIENPRLPEVGALLTPPRAGASFSAGMGRRR
jgi:hypothetical protein